MDEDPIIITPPRPPPGGVEGKAEHARLSKTPAEMGRGLLGASLAGGRRPRARSSEEDADYASYVDSDAETASVASSHGGAGGRGRAGRRSSMDELAVGIDSEAEHEGEGGSGSDSEDGEWGRGRGGARRGRGGTRQGKPAIPPRIPLARRAGDPEPTPEELAAIEEKRTFAKKVFQHPFTQILASAPPVEGAGGGSGAGADGRGGGRWRSSARAGESAGASPPDAPTSGSAGSRHQLVASGVFKAPPHVAAAVGRSLLRRL